MGHGVRQPRRRPGPPFCWTIWADSGLMHGDRRFSSNSCPTRSGKQNSSPTHALVILIHFSPSLAALLCSSPRRTKALWRWWRQRPRVPEPPWARGACIRLRVEVSPPSGFLMVPEGRDGTRSVGDKRCRSIAVPTLFYPCMRSGDPRMVLTATKFEVSCHHILAWVRNRWPVA
jgi:hypothetical protein